MTLKKACATTGVIAVLASASLLAQRINGAGATFPNPIYSKWFAEYNKLHPKVRDQLPVDRIRRRHPADQQSAPCSSARRTGR